MGQIKSALEIALERAEDIHSDPEQEREQELIQKGKRLAGSYLFDINTTIETVRETFSRIPEDELSLVREGIREVILANITLPQSEHYVEDLGRIKELTNLLSGNAAGSDDLFAQIDNLYSQYLQNREQLEQRVLEQVRPQLEQKQRQLSQQAGRNVEYRPEQDKEFTEMLQHTYKRLDEQYQEILDQIKDSLVSLSS